MAVEHLLEAAVAVVSAPPVRRDPPDPQAAQAVTDNPEAQGNPVQTLLHHLQLQAHQKDAKNAKPLKMVNQDQQDPQDRLAHQDSQDQQTTKADPDLQDLPDHLDPTDSLDHQEDPDNLDPPDKLPKDQQSQAPQAQPDPREAQAQTANPANQEVMGTQEIKALQAMPAAPEAPDNQEALDKQAHMGKMVEKALATIVHHHEQLLDIRWNRERGKYGFIFEKKTNNLLPLPTALFHKFHGKQDFFVCVLLLLFMEFYSFFGK